MSARFVAAMMFSRSDELTRRADSGARASSAHLAVAVGVAVEFALPMASISSMKMIAGAFVLASANASLTELGAVADEHLH